MRRDNVQFHRNGYGPSYPAVNVKVHKGMTEGLREFRQYEPEASPRFTEEWIRENLNDDQIESWWQDACQLGFEQAEGIGQEIFDNVKIYSEGRSSGWIVVHGLKDFESWNAVDLAKWAKFAKACRSLADDIPYQFVSNVYHNVFLTAEEEQDQALREEQERSLS